MIKQIRYYRSVPTVKTAFQTDEPVEIETLEGTMTASPGDFIVRGVTVEYYPCKPDVFKRTYELLDIYCNCCGSYLSGNDSSWRWNGSDWEHKCPCAHPQAGHCSMRPVANNEAVGYHVVQLDTAGSRAADAKQEGQ